MKNNNSSILLKNSLFAIIMLLLFFLLIQQKFQIFTLKPLKGSYTLRENSPFTVKSWLEGNYQDQKQKYIEENIGFRNFFVRVNNQIAFSFFNNARANGIVIGKNNYLYEKHYITSHLGRNFIGRDSITDKVQKLKMVQLALKNRNIDLLVVLAAGKGTFYSEFIPKKFSPKNKTISNYDVYLEELKKNMVNHIDFNQWFLEMKDTASYPLFPKCGIHWSVYGNVLAADSIIKYIQSLRKINMPEIRIEKIELPDSVRHPDDDIERGMNLLFNIPDLKMAYPSFKIIKDNNTVEPKVLTIADSYYWNMFNWGLSSNVFNHGQFWFYNKQIYPDSYEKPITVDELDFRKEIEKNDVILLMSTDALLDRFAYGFIESAFEAYYGDANNTKDPR
ncbi:hypothetical protein ACFLSY_06455 [Bacteroidota bacterium]